MKLWNDYEGKILADRYTLGSLLRPEGRSALFTFTAGPGSPAIIRITESLNDEGEMLSTWRRIGDLKQAHLLSISDCGEAVFEGTPLTYAVLEPTDGTLDDLLTNRPLTQPEAMEVAAALVCGLSALHRAELVHEHIAANNVFAVGEEVKLRADCARRVVVDGEFITNDDRGRLIRQDIHDLGYTLLRALTLEKKLRPGLNLAAPFDKVVPHALDGSWTLDQIARVVVPPTPAKPAPVVSPAASAAKPAAVPGKPATAAPVARPVPAGTSPAAVAAALAPSGQTSLPYPGPATVPVATAAPVPRASTAGQPDTTETDNPLLYQRRIQVPTVSAKTSLPRWAPLAIAAALILGVILYLVHGSSADKSQNSALNSASAHTLSQAVPHPAASAVQRPAAPADEGSSVANSSPVATHVQPGWYVIAYTFNHEEQALKRAAAIVHRYPGLHPQVIAPNGGSFMVALGGAMSRNEAEATRNHARRAGMPRDTFVRNYGG